MTFCLSKTSFVHSRSGTYHALLLGYFGMKFLPNVRHPVCWVLVEIWVPLSSQKICNKFFIHHCQGWKEGSFVCETVWFFSWVNTYPFDLKFVEFCPKLSGDSYMDFQEKTIMGEFFRNFVQIKAEIWVPDSSHKIDNKFFIHHCQSLKEGSFVCETVWFFSRVNTHLFDMKFVAFCPKFSGDSCEKFQEKTISGEFLEILCKPRLSSTKTC